jgi:hypothetical protein
MQEVFRQNIRDKLLGKWRDKTVKGQKVMDSRNCSVSQSSHKIPKKMKMLKKVCLVRESPIQQNDKYSLNCLYRSFIK